MPKTVVQKRERLSQVAYDRIKAMILQKELTPGQLVSEADLQQVLEIGRTPVREALLALAQNGLVTVHPRKGIEVARPTLKTIHDIYQFRSLMEPAILRQCFAQVDRQWAADLRERLADCGAAGQDVSQMEADLIGLDNRFHLELADTLHNQYISEQLRRLVDYLSLIRFTVWGPDQYLESTKTHMAILDAILADNLEDACRLLSWHLKMSYQEAVESLEQVEY